MNTSENQKKAEAAAQVEENILHKGKIFSLKREILSFNDKTTHTWDIIVHPGAVALIPITESSNLLLLKQWRRAIGKIIIELPAGTLEEGENPLICAQRELQEETGYMANSIEPFGGIYSAPGFTTEYIHLFIAKDLILSPLPGDDNEGIDVIEVSLSESIRMIETNQIGDAKTIIGILHYARFH